jgi:hypothetical protein
MFRLYFILCFLLTTSVSFSGEELSSWIFDANEFLTSEALDTNNLDAKEFHTSEALDANNFSAENTSNPIWEKIEYFLRPLLNVAQNSVGPALCPSELNSLIKNNILDASISQNNSDTFIELKKQDGTSFIVTKCAHDIDTNIPPEHYRILNYLAGRLSLSDVLNKIKVCNFENAKISVPLVQNNPYRIGQITFDPLKFRKTHFAFLIFTIENKKFTHADFYDSQNSLSSFIYDHKTYIYKHLKIAELSDLTLIDHFTGHQGLLNFNDCGAFVAAFITMQEKGIEINNVSTYLSRKFVNEIVFKYYLIKMEKNIECIGKTYSSYQNNNVFELIEIFD